MHRALVLLVAATAIAAASAPAEPAGRTIQITLVLGSRPTAPAGRFTLSGAIADTGVAARRVSPSRASAGSTISLAGSRGTITLAIFGARTPADTDWAIVGGTGAYRG